MAYDPPRQAKPKPTGDPLEVDLAFNVRPCGTCSFFWPKDAARPPYGPYPAYDFDSNAPALAQPAGNPESFLWTKATTRPATFPDAEIMDGCRKAPIMTIGINPNLTAFAPGPTGAAWCYPSFSSDQNTNSWAKYAYYYRYRSVYQERFDATFVQRFLQREGRIVATAAGTVVSAERLSDAPHFTLQVRYDGAHADTNYALEDPPGGPRQVVLVDSAPPNNRFAKGALLAARLDVPKAHATGVYAQQIGYYERFVPVLESFAAYLRTKGHAQANLRMGEDVCQLDMVACASPHWGPSWLGGSNRAVRTIIDNCVTRNAWAIKQLVQTRPAVLFLVGEASYRMFQFALGRLIKADPALPELPEDGAFTLMRATSNAAHPCRLMFAMPGKTANYRLDTRLVVTPHFSYGEFFLPQYRFSRAAWASFAKSFAPCMQFLQTDARCRLRAATSEAQFAAVELVQDASAVVAQIGRQWPQAARELAPLFYDATASMLGVLQDSYSGGQLQFAAETRGAGHLARTQGPCSFCVNRHWTFPLGCPYDKNQLEQVPAAFLEEVTAAMLKAGAMGGARATAKGMLDDGFTALQQHRTSRA